MTAQLEAAETLNDAIVPVPAGSFLIERYVYDHGTQWVVHRVEADGSLSQLIVTDTRRAAAHHIASLSKFPRRGTQK